MRRVVVLSVDAMVFEDTELLHKLPVFSELWDKTARVERVRSIYPTITYPCHTTMMTGVYPDRHGIISNEQEIPGERKPKWTHFRQSVTAPTFFDKAKEAGMTTASVFWPVTGCDPNIDYLINEYWPQNAETSDADAFRESGTSEEVMQRIVLPNLPVMEGKPRKHPFSDDFIYNCSNDILRAYKPNLLAIHHANIDHYRHKSGVFTPLVEHGVHEVDHYVGNLLKAAEDAGVLEETDFFIVSDHGQMDIRRAVAINAIFAEEGLISIGENGELTDWRAWVKSGGLSALVYVKDPADEKRVYDILCRLRDDGVYGVSEVFTREEAARDHHLDGKFSFVLETDGMTTFSTEWERPLVRPLTNADYRVGRATHGYLPHKGPQPTLIAFGPHIKPGVVLPHANLIDEAPTIAHVLGLDMGDVEGRILHEILL
ncbi:MAG: alkaline phosphatase family protein [Clostridia bacterium]|nr:alkaline phosphatase family protein [Clostridia bacterium]